MDLFRRMYYGSAKLELAKHGEDIYIERFINICNSKGVRLKLLRKTAKSSYVCHVLLSQLDMIYDVCEKLNLDVRVIKTKGVIPFVRMIEAHLSLTFGILTGILISLVCNMFIWDIDVSGEYSHTESELTETIDMWGVRVGSMKKDIHYNDLERQLRDEYNDISFVSAQVNGSILSVIIKEGTVLNKSKESDDTGSIISDYDGVVIEMIVRRGTKVVRKGAGVKKGDVLVEGKVDIVDDSQVVIKNELCLADADVYIQTDLPVNISFPIKEKQKVYSGDKKTERYVKFSDRNFFLYKPFNQYNSCAIMSEDFNVRLFDTFDLPVIIGKKEYYEYEEEEVTLDKKAVDEKFEKLKSDYAKELKEKGINVRKWNVNIHSDNNKAVLSGDITVVVKADTYIPVNTNQKDLEENQVGSN